MRLVLKVKIEFRGAVVVEADKDVQQCLDQVGFAGAIIADNGDGRIAGFKC